MTGQGHPHWPTLLGLGRDGADHGRSSREAPHGVRYRADRDRSGNRAHLVEDAVVGAGSAAGSPRDARS
jgi:hypothetical protein